MYAKRSLSACLVLGLVLLSTLVVSTQGPVPECHYRGPAPASAVLPAQTLPARLWIPLIYKNKVAPRVVWRRNGPDENPRYYWVHVSFQNSVGYQIEIDRFTTNLISASGQVVGTWTAEPGDMLWILEPGENMGVVNVKIPTYGDEPVDVHANVTWHQTEEQFVSLTITKAEIIHCSDLGSWNELCIHLRNTTGRVVHQATLLVYGEELAPWDHAWYGDTSSRWDARQILLTELQPGEEAEPATGKCLFENTWYLDSLSSAKCVARLSDTSSY